jgi:hypothetical protein
MRLEHFIGKVIGFDENFRTKNYRNYVGSIYDDIDKDPHIYKQLNGIKWIFTIDPKWITTSTAQSEFCSGTTRFSGLAMIKSITKKEVICTPLVLGIKKSEWGI